MIKQTTLRVDQSFYESVISYINSHNISSFNSFVISSLKSAMRNTENTPVIYKEEDSYSFQYLKTTLDDYKKQVQLKDEQLKIKDQQIFSLIAVQKDLTEKTTEQVKLLGDKIALKKWYQFWK